MSNEKLQPYETKMQKSLDALEREYTTIRAGRANPHILDKLKVDYYGTPTPLQQVGNVTVPEARVLMIQPWESKLIKDIEKAILASDIGITPTNDGKSIRLVFPELTEERRLDQMLAKDVPVIMENIKGITANFELVSGQLKDLDLVETMQMRYLVLQIKIGI